MIRAGRLRNRLVLERVRETRDTHGGFVEEWYVVGDHPLWAAIRNPTDRETHRADALEVRASVVVELRDRIHIGATDRFRRPDGALLNVGAVLEPEKPGEALLVLCTEPRAEDDP